MTDWILTLGLQNLRHQINEAFPDRDHESDGTISDAAHQRESRTGHSPDDTPGSNPEWDGDPDSTPEVRAWDMDSDLCTPGVTAQQVVDHIRHLPGVSSVLRYIIYNRKIYKASNGWTAEDYTGASLHLEHVHFSGAWSQAADNNQSFDYHLEEIPVALTATDKAWIAGQIDAAVAKVWDHRLVDPYDEATPTHQPRQLDAGTWLRYAASKGAVQGARAEILAAIAALDEKPSV